MSDTQDQKKQDMTKQLPATITYEQSLQMIRNPMLMPGSYLERLVYQAKMFHKSGLIPESIKSPEAALVVMMKGIEVGLAPMEAFSHIHIIKGKPTMSAESMKNLVYRNCKDAVINIIESTETVCTLEGEKPRHKPMRLSFSIEDAKKAELFNKPGDMWKKYPKAMLLSRATTALCRAYFSEFLCGVSYAPEELGLPTDEKGDPIDVTPQRSTKAPPQKQPEQRSPVQKEQAIDAQFEDASKAQEADNNPSPPEPGSFAAFDATTMPPSEAEKPKPAEIDDKKRSFMWSEMKALLSGNELEAKEQIKALIGEKPSKEWDQADYEKVLNFIADAKLAAAEKTMKEAESKLQAVK